MTQPANVAQLGMHFQVCKQIKHPISQSFQIKFHHPLNTVFSAWINDTNHRLNVATEGCREGGGL